MLHNTREEFEDFANPASLEAFGSPGWEPENVDPKARKRLRDMGCWEVRVAVLPEGPVGRWLVQRPSVLLIDDTLFVHGGLGVECGLAAPGDINQRVREEVCAAPDWVPDLTLLDSAGPHWHRDYVLRRDPESGRELDHVLAYHRCNRMVVGHTPTKRLGPEETGKVSALYGGKLFCADTGIGRFHGGHLSALRIEEGEAFPIYPGAA
jgi:hypothetical protein